ncbi:hypothetical protein L6164_029503 [Bauhinia variegata]|uniref:Uncharacterized protein n=1 Tax=Bauhinia variegata TaxID=167791 RepID=A0ACB9LAT2_BAUVA|nr:hypothetical protein L6164_029503 [Bauhinia variegata]
MASNGAKEPSLPRPLDSEAQNIKRQLNKRRYLRCRSAPLAGLAAPEKNGIDSNPRSESILGKLHPSLRQVAICLAAYLGVGAVVFYLVRHQLKGKKTNGFLDAVYFTIVTMTTLGYGDLVPNSVLTKLLACAFVFTGMAMVALILSKAADYLVEKQEIFLIKALNRKKLGETDVLRKVQVNRTRYKLVLVLFLLLIFIVVGTTVLATVEKLSLVDAFYCVCSTLTTLGYGDKSFSTKAGRVFAVFWIWTGTICLGQLFLYVAELKTESRQKELVNWVLNKKMTHLDLEAADLDGDGTVGAAEFVIYKLKEMGKVTQNDISLILKEFEELDVDQSGTLSFADIALAQGI